MTGPRPELLSVGRVVRPHGLRGQVVVELWTNREERMEPGACLTWAGGSLIVERSIRFGDSGGRHRWLVSFDGVDGRDGAEKLRDAVLRASPIDDPEALWVDELIGAGVYDQTGALLGLVEAVESNPASDLLVLTGGGLIPLRFVTSWGDRRLSVDVPAGLLDT
jgi:16S rRNA processing protein RimM